MDAQTIQLMAEFAWLAYEEGCASHDRHGPESAWRTPHVNTRDLHIDIATGAPWQQRVHSMLPSVQTLTPHELLQVRDPGCAGQGAGRV